MSKAVRTACALVCSLIVGTAVAAAQSAAPQASQGRGQGRGRGNRPDMATLPRPIDMYDTVWIGDMTQLEIRDLLKAGKTTALLFVGGMEDNGPYVTVSQHNSISRAMCESIARKLGNALCAPVVDLSPGNPETAKNPGSITMSPDTYKALLADMATSLKTEGFKNIMIMTDHGGDVRGATETAAALEEKWKGSGAHVFYVPEFYDSNNGQVVKFEQEVLGVNEKSEGYHDDYYTAAITVAINPEDARMPERIKAHKTTLNGVEMNTPKAAEDGKKIIEFRSDAAVKAIRRLVGNQ